ncbi:PE-PPE domain-containing protein [Mycobacterium sp.]|uniref:PE family protein n=1 Tax=Mycobacterium sp. TaxID=1785 RepID=UPI002CC16223|nr:PE-PPE domain-containing protein [Mycobacterium sp.]HTY34471.1 PE-PPE domain-containing protein [Mycobacterium sp.]
MSYVIAAPEIMASAATDLATIGSNVDVAHMAAAVPTVAVLPAAPDEVSTATAKLFGGYAQKYQAVLAQAAAFREEFVAALASAGNAYAVAEAASASAISGALGQLTSPIQSLLGGAPATPTALTPMVVQPTLQGTTIGLIMGGSGVPIPAPSDVTVALNYLNQHFNVLPPNALALFTPEGLYPFTGVKSLPLDVSVSQGVQILDSAIKQQLAANPSGSVAVFGASQSAVVASLEMDNLANPMLNPTPPSANQLGFTLVGDQMNPNGGILARFPGFPAGQPLQIPSMGITFYGATPSNTIYPTHIYTLEYDGFADFPQYPINFLADLNAFAGIYYVHNTYPGNPSLLPPGYAIQQLPTSPGYTGVTTYSMITTPNGLPLLEPLRAIPVIGNPIADLLQPDLTTIVNLGYGNPNYGYSTGPADVQTYFGLFPHVSQALIAQDLITGAHQGAVAFTSDIHAEAAGVSLSSVSHSLTSMAGTGAADLSALSTAASSPDSIIETIQAATTNIANGISGTAANLYAAALPTADIANFLVTVLPAYDVNLFLSGIQQAINGNVLGGLQYALIAPLAADAGLLTMAGGFELLVVLSPL